MLKRRDCSKRVTSTELTTQKYSTNLVFSRSLALSLVIRLLVSALPLEATEAELLARSRWLVGEEERDS